MQMSHEWTRTRIERDIERLRARIVGNYSRHVMVVTPTQAYSHVVALGKILKDKMESNPVRAQVYAEEHASHDIALEFGEAALDDANKTYSQNGKPPKKPAAAKRK
jgi:hypothetical protein